MKKVAVMQPYFMPYLGYFRLFQAADHFMFFDCVQFPRRGWVHRNKLENPHSKDNWLTLPLEKQPRETSIKDLRFNELASSVWEERLSRYPWLASPPAHALALYQAVKDIRPTYPAVDYIIDTLMICIEEMKIECTISRTSELNLPATLKSQSRVAAAVKAVGGKEYINPPGGMQLYDKSYFKDQGLKLHFLSPFEGDMRSILARAYNDDWDSLSYEMALTTNLVAA